MCSADLEGAVGVEFTSPAEASALLRQAGVLAQAGTGGLPLMAGKQLALLSPDSTNAVAVEFIEAAKALGAHVSFVRAGLDDRSTAAQIDATARMLGQLYDAVECQQLPVGLVRRMARVSGVPVFAGLATPAHPTARLVAALQGDAPARIKRRCILQAALLASMG